MTGVEPLVVLRLLRRKALRYRSSEAIYELIDQLINDPCRDIAKFSSRSGRRLFR